MRIRFLVVCILFAGRLPAQTISFRDIAGKWVEEKYPTAIWEFKDEHTLSIYGFGADQLWKFRIDSATKTTIYITDQETGGLINDKLTYSLTFTDARHLTVHLMAIWAYNPPGKKEKIPFGTEWQHSTIDNGPVIRLIRPAQ